MKSVLLGVIAAILPSLVLSQTSLPQPYLEANVPGQAALAALLKRDLLAYFQRSGFASARNVEYELLRSQPTQSGAAYPKYYAWVKVTKDGSLLQEGAVRLAAIEQSKFDVTDFVTRSQAQQRPRDVSEVFPALLVPKIIALARTH